MSKKNGNQGRGKNSDGKGVIENVSHAREINAGRKAYGRII